MLKHFVLFALALLCFNSCISDDQLTEDALLESNLRDLIKSRSVNNDLSYYIMPSSTDFDNIPQDPNNPLNPYKVALGKLLFHETAFTFDNRYQNSAQTYSCASCHHAGAGFQSGNAQGIGDGGLGFGINGEGRMADLSMDLRHLDVQAIRSPSILNLAFQENLLWNGKLGSGGANAGYVEQWDSDTGAQNNSKGYEGLETQAIAGIGVHRMGFDEASIIEYNYKEDFDNAFPDLEDSIKYSNEGAALAIAAYERTVFANKAPFQDWLKGDEQAMSTVEKRGAMLFFGKAGCYSCHNGPSLALMDYAALGLNDLKESNPFFIPPIDSLPLGRGFFTKNSEDYYRFKIPQLYNLKDNPFYGHGSSINSLIEMIEYKNLAIPENSLVPEERLDDRFVPLGLTEEEVVTLTIFIQNSLYDPNLDRYVPDYTNSLGCFPNNDPISQQDLNCF